MNNFFKKTSNSNQNVGIEFSEPSNIDFYHKNFHLSGNFLEGKKVFADKLENLGANCSGKKHEQVSIKNTDYFVLADLGVKESGKHKPNGGKNVNKIQEYNNKHKKIMIPILKETYCKKLMDDYKKYHLSKTKP